MHTLTGISSRYLSINPGTLEEDWYYKVILENRDSYSSYVVQVGTPPLHGTCTADHSIGESGQGSSDSNNGVVTMLLLVVVVVVAYSEQL